MTESTSTVMGPPGATAAEAPPILEVRNVSKRFGGIQAVNNASIAVRPGIVTGVIGPNGSGKSTLFNLITGLARIDSGEVLFKNRPVTNLSPNRINRLGIGRTFQLTRLFGKMTAHENLVVVARSGRQISAARADELLDLLSLSHIRDEYAENLSYGQQKLIEFLRLMMTEPSLVLLDEPFAGVNPVMGKRLLAQMSGWLESGKTILLTDHEMTIMMEFCEELFVLDHGEVIAQGHPEEIRRDERVMEAYFGR